MTTSGHRRHSSDELRHPYRLAEGSRLRGIALCLGHSNAPAGVGYEERERELMGVNVYGKVESCRRQLKAPSWSRVSHRSKRTGSDSWNRSRHTLYHEIKRKKPALTRVHGGAEHLSSVTVSQNRCCYMLPITFPNGDWVLSHFLRLSNVCVMKSSLKILQHRESVATLPCDLFDTFLTRCDHLSIFLCLRLLLVFLLNVV